jgi:N-acetylglucosaminyldiphosphoundecaprenol N-acetyl-beta-D-mannosaminyltransferase
MGDFPKRRILGVEIAKLSIAEAVEAATLGGLVLAPSGPGLCDLESDAMYRRALEEADVILADSGLAILLMKFLGLGWLPRTSGLGFLETLLKKHEVKSFGSTFWVMPDGAAMERNLSWLRSQGLSVGEENCHLAPIYPKRGEVRDEALLASLKRLKPRFIFVCTGSGSQEKLGLWLQENLSENQTICCIGAAIGFLSGDQVRIPAWADRMCLGWVLRCLSEPQKFIPRYAKATRLIWLVLRYRDKAPPCQPKKPGRSEQKMRETR